MKYNKWKIPYDPPVIPAALLDEGYPPLLASILSLRGCGTAESARSFLRGGSELLENPFLLKDMDKAVARIRQAVENGETVAVYGDYDVDGITSTCLLTDYLRSLGLVCESYIPDRLEEGYGLNAAAIDALAARGASLIITVDCGVTGLSEARHAKEIGVDMIITDHHECMETLPEAAAVVDPKRPDCTYPNEGLAGVGVAFKLICAISGDTQACLDRCCDLVAVGTIADVMPLLGENRYIAAEGIRKLRQSPSVGLRALLEKAGIGDKKVGASTIGFSLAPRINAAGRLGKATRAGELLMCAGTEQALALAEELCSMNRKRQSLEQKIWDEALAMIGDTKPDRPLVLASRGWHQGVIGIVASRLAESFGLPTVMICLDGEHGKGSCRSYGGFNLFEALNACSGCLLSFGGHAMAAGMNISPERIDEFREALARYYEQNPPDRDVCLEVDLRIDDPELLSMADVESLELLEPCGNGNPRPVFCLQGALLTEVTPIGSGRHLRLHVQKFGKLFECVYFSCTPAELDAKTGELVDVAFSPQINEYRSRRSLQLVVSALRRHDALPLCRRLLSGGLPSTGDTRDCLPDRPAMVRLWKALGALGGSFSGTEAELAAVAEQAGLYPPLACVGLRAFAELGLLELDYEENALALRIIPDAPKADLNRSALLCSLARQAGLN